MTSLPRNKGFYIFDRLQMSNFWDYFVFHLDRLKPEKFRRNVRWLLQEKHQRFKESSEYVMSLSKLLEGSLPTTLDSRVPARVELPTNSDK